MQVGKSARIIAGIGCLIATACSGPVLSPPLLQTQTTVPYTGLSQTIPFSQNFYTGSLTIPATASTPPANDAITMIASQTAFSAPPALLSAGRRLTSDSTTTDVPLLYFQLTASGTTVFTSQPSFSINIPSRVHPSDGPFYVAFYDPTATSPAWALGLEGPGVVNGSELTFTPPPGSFKLQAGASYYYAVYQMVSSTPLASIGVTPSALTIFGTGSNNAKTATIQESGYAGAFSESDTCASIASISSSPGAGPTSTVTVTGIANGSCTATFTDAFGQQAKLSVTVTISGFVISSHERKV